MKQMDYYFGFRFGSFIIIWVVLMITLIGATTSKVILSSLILYFIPIALDYYGHTPLEERNENRRNFALWVSIGLTVICIALLLPDANFKAFLVHIVTKIIFCIISSLFVCLACIDWVLYSSENEVKYREKIREQQRNQQRIYRFEERVKSNQNIKEA